MATVDSTQPSPLNSTGRGSNRGGQRGRGRVAFLNFGRRQQQVPQEPPQEPSQDQPQEGPMAQSDSHSQQSSDRSRRGRQRRRQGKQKVKEGDATSGRATPASERGETTAGNLNAEATVEKTARPQLSGEQDQAQQQDFLSDGGSSPSFSLNTAAQKSAPPSKNNQPNTVPLPQQLPAVGKEELKALIESQHRKTNERCLKAAANPHAMRDIKQDVSQRLPTDVKPSSSYNNWGDATPADRSDEPPSRQFGGSRKGKGREKRIESRPRQQPRQENLPQGSHLLGDAPMGTPPNQRRTQLPLLPRSFGGNRTENAPDKANSHSPRRAGTPDRDRPKNSRVVPTRTFGGQLTKENSEDSSGDGRLRPDAATFEPGRPVEYLPPHLRATAHRPNAAAPNYDQWGHGGNAVAQSGSSSQRPIPSPSIAPRGAPQANTRNNAGKTRGKAKPQHDLKLDGKKFPLVKQMRPHTNTLKGAEDIGTRIHKEITSAAYECMVCYGILTRNSKVWNCKCCWAVFHLHCVTKWAKQGLEQAPSRTIGADGEPSRRSWRCPACNNPEDQVPDMYTCWCKKTVQPEASKYLPPHR